MSHLAYEYVRVMHAGVVRELSGRDSWATDTAGRGPLAGLRVVELSSYEGVQYCGRLLAMLAATVIKVEGADGDPIRRRPPFGRAGDGSPISIPFAYLNEGKRSVRTDLSEPRDVAALRKLIATADVVLVSPEYREFLQVAAPVRESQLVVRVGTLGGYIDARPETAFTRFHTGITGYLVPAEARREYRPAWPGPYAFEIVHGVCIATATLAELLAGCGGEVDYSYQAYSLWLEKMMVPRVVLSQVPELHRWTAAQPFAGIVPCKDGFVCIFVIEEHQWVGLCRAMKRPEWIGDPRFADGIRRVANKETIHAEVVRWCSEISVDEAIASGIAESFPVGRVRKLTELPSWQLLQERQFFQRVDLGFGEVTVPGWPFGKEFTKLIRADAGGATARPGCWTQARIAKSGDVKSGDVAGHQQPQRSAGSQALPLAGIRVLDFTWAAAGPGITSLMAYLGADVVKVELRTRPDLMRIAGAQYGYGKTDIDHSPSFEEIGAGKRSIELDLRRDEDRAVALELAKVADVVVENMRPGKIEQLGLSYERLSALNPRLIMCSQSGTGRTTSPGVPGYAPVFWAEGGGAWMTGWPDGLPGVVRGAIDFHAATFACFGIMVLLHHRARTGRGGYLDCSAIEAVVSLFGVELLALEHSTPGRAGNEFAGMLFNDVLPCRGDDQWVAVSVADEAAWRCLTDVLGVDVPAPYTLAAEPFDTTYRQLADASARWHAADLAAQLRRAGVPAVWSFSLRRSLNDELLIARGAWQFVPAGTGKRQIVGLPWTVDGAAYDCPRPAPCLGEHTDEVLAEWLGRTAGGQPAKRKELTT